MQYLSSGPFERRKSAPNKPVPVRSVEHNTKHQVCLFALRFLSTHCWHSTLASHDNAGLWKGVKALGVYTSNLKSIEPRLQTWPRRLQTRPRIQDPSRPQNLKSGRLLPHRRFVRTASHAYSENRISSSVWFGFPIWDAVSDERRRIPWRGVLLRQTMITIRELAKFIRD